MDEKGMKELIESAAQEAQCTGIEGLEEKLQEAVKLGVVIGTKLGIEIGAEKGAEAGAAAAVRAVERERKKIRRKEYDRRLYNTKLLLRNYRTLNAHYHNAVFDVRKAEEADETFAEIMQRMNASRIDEELYIESIKQSAVRTKVIMSHVNRMLEVYETMCEKSERPEAIRHWRVLDSVYLTPRTIPVEAVAERENISKRTVYKDLDICIADLTSLLFGIDGLK